METTTYTYNPNAGNMIVCCSGAADLGHLSDLVTRKIAKEKISNMSCLALFASCGEEKLEELKQKNLWVIDGCSIDCGKKIMAQRGITNYKYQRLTDMGYTKGQTPVNDKMVNEIFEKVIK